MLTARDRRVLGEIAEGLGQEDPEFVRQFRSTGGGRGHCTSGRAVVSLGAALVAMVVCAVLLMPVAAMTAAASAVAVLVYAAAGQRRRARATW